MLLIKPSLLPSTFRRRILLGDRSLMLCCAPGAGFQNLFKNSAPFVFRVNICHVKLHNVYIAVKQLCDIG